MNKFLDRSGFVIFSNDLEYEFNILGRYFASDPVPENIIFVYSRKNDVSGVFSERLAGLNKKVLVVPFEDYNKIENASLIESLDMSRTVMVIKDLRFMLKRLDERLSMMQIKHSCYKKIVIDAMPFVVNPWKFYFPYSFFDKSLLGYSHSYAFEAAIRNYEEDPTLDDPVDPVVLAGKVYPVTFINYRKFFNFSLSFDVYRITESELLGYEKLKKELFDGENSIKKIIGRLHAYASSMVVGYNVPLKLDRVYEWCGDVVIRRTNLKVDDYLCSEMNKLIGGMNILVAGLYGD